MLPHPKPNRYIDAFAITFSSLNNVAEHHIIPASLTSPTICTLCIQSSPQPSELCRLAQCSRALYLFSSHDPLWRNLVLQHYNCDFDFNGSWKRTFVRCAKSSASTLSMSASGDLTGISLKFTGFYSDALYNPWLLGRMEMRSEWLAERRPVDRRAGLSKIQFVEQYERASCPVVLTDVVPTWPAFSKWNRDYLTKQYGDHFSKVAGRNMKVSNFFRYCDSGCDARPLYLFDSQFASKCPSLAADYKPPDYFEDDFLKFLAGPGMTRPDYRFLIIGPARSGSSFRKSAER